MTVDLDEMQHCAAFHQGLYCFQKYSFREYKELIVIIHAALKIFKFQYYLGSSVVECLTRDRGVAGSSLTGVTVLCP